MSDDEDMLFVGVPPASLLDESVNRDKKAPSKKCSSTTNIVVATICVVVFVEYAIGCSLWREREVQMQRQHRYMVDVGAHLGVLGKPGDFRQASLVLGPRRKTGCFRLVAPEGAVVDIAYTSPDMSRPQEDEREDLPVYVSASVTPLRDIRSHRATYSGGVGQKKTFKPTSQFMKKGATTNHLLHTMEDDGEAKICIRFFGETSHILQQFFINATITGFEHPSEDTPHDWLNFPNTSALN